MRPAMYTFINRGLKMSPGKLAAQAQHAAVEAYRLTEQYESELKEWGKPTKLDAWYEGGHYAKLVMLAEDDVHLLTIKHYLEERGFGTVLIIDEGRTEIKPHSMTALGVRLVDRDDPHTAATFESFKTYREPKAPKKHPGLNFIKRK